MKLRHSPGSPYVRKVMAVAIETGLAGRIEKVPTKAGPVTPNESLQADNPLAKVPALTTDSGEVLYDSPVICEYLDTLHDGRKLFPAAGPARWTALRRQALADGILDAAILGRYEVALRPAELRWDAWIEGQRRKVRGGLDALEREALDGTVDIGTIAVACAVGYLDFRQIEEGWRSARPRLAAWFAEFGQRPSLQETMPQG